jgi:hypothetical protein
LFGHYEQGVAAPDRVEVVGGWWKIRLFWGHIEKSFEILPVGDR